MKLKPWPMFLLGTGVAVGVFAFVLPQSTLDMISGVKKKLLPMPDVKYKPAVQPIAPGATVTPSSAQPAATAVYDNWVPSQ
jgi:hypothetical protein